MSLCDKCDRAVTMIYDAAIYIEQFALSHGLRSADALIAATAAESNLALCSANKKHFQFLNDIEFIPFEPEVYLNKSG